MLPIFIKIQRFIVQEGVAAMNEVYSARWMLLESGKNYFLLIGPPFMA